MTPARRLPQPPPAVTPVALSDPHVPVRPCGALSWSALGCTVDLRTERAEDLASASTLLAQVLRDVDDVASRFRPDSDLSRANAAPGRWVQVDPLLVSAVQVALDAAEATGGLVHPLLGRSLVELGYDADLRLVRLREETGDAGLGALPAPPPLDSWRDVGLDDDAIRVPVGTTLDLGATAKAWCADLAVAAFAAAGLRGAVASVGGDLRTFGERSWTVRVAERPGLVGDAAGRTELVDAVGALATSSVLERRWRRGGEERHHLLDPRTGRPTTGPWRTVTVAAPTTVAANVASTEALVLGEDAVARLTAEGRAARLVDHDGRVVTTPGWPAPAEPSWTDLPRSGGAR
ncbi:FAD:protein FMN transferase [Nocardioides sp. GY 10127]|uniref:FAD:protein FMN transferase n=1 Tax=Nocardioides sp. GY 10127 TaxID=2569762 RepID=UPI001458E8AE|nr:FAD:protein FMN transferase [Nocardioides sp. GY 10127]